MTVQHMSTEIIVILNILMNYKCLPRRIHQVWENLHYLKERNLDLCNQSVLSIQVCRNVSWLNF